MQVAPILGFFVPRGRNGCPCVQWSVAFTQSGVCSADANVSFLFPAGGFPPDALVSESVCPVHGHLQAFCPEAFPQMFAVCLAQQCV